MLPASANIIPRSRIHVSTIPCALCNDSCYQPWRNITLSASLPGICSSSLALEFLGRTGVDLVHNIKIHVGIAVRLQEPESSLSTVLIHRIMRAAHRNSLTFLALGYSSRSYGGREAREPAVKSTARGQLGKIGISRSFLVRVWLPPHTWAHPILNSNQTSGKAGAH